MPIIALLLWLVVVAVGTVASLLLHTSLKAESGILLILSGIALGVCLLAGLSLVLYCQKRVRNLTALTIYFVGTILVGGLVALTREDADILRFGNHADETAATEVPDSKWREWRLQPTKRDGKIVELRSTVVHDETKQARHRSYKSAEYPLPIMLQLNDLEVLEYDDSRASPLRYFLPKLLKLERCTLYGVDLSTSLVAEEAFGELSRLPQLKFLRLRRCLPADDEKLRQLAQGLRSDIQLDISQ